MTGPNSSRGSWHTCSHLFGAIIRTASIAHPFVQLKDTRQKHLPGWMKKSGVIYFQYLKLLSSVTLGSSCSTAVYTYHLPVSSSAARMFYSFGQSHHPILSSKNPSLESLSLDHAPPHPPTPATSPQILCTSYFLIRLT